MIKVIKTLSLVAALAGGASSAHAMDIACNVQEVGIHGGGTADARVVARCLTPVSGVSWIAVPLSNAALADRFLDVMTAAFLSGRTVSAWAPSQGTGCFNNCRITNQFSVWK